MSRLHRPAASSLLVLALVAAPACADELFLAFDSDIAGGSTDPRHRGALRLLSYSLGVEADTSWTRGGGASVGKPQPGEFRFTMEIDRALPAMHRLITRGLAAAAATLTVRSDVPGNRAGFEYAKVRFAGLFFTGVDQALAGPGRAVAAVSGVYKSVQIEVYEPGSPDPASCTKWDVPSGVVEDC
jgi:type VI protein secretion system component Hcp